MRPADVRRLVARRPVGLAVLVALTMVRLLTDFGWPPAVADEVYLLAMTALIVGWCLLVLVATESVEAPTSAAFRRHQLAERPPRLTVLEDRAEYGVRTAYANPRTLRNQLRSLAVDRLSRVGISVDDESRARALLGETGWLLTRPDSAWPQDNPGVRLREAQVLDLARTLMTLAQPDFGQPTTPGEQH